MDLTSLLTALAGKSANTDWRKNALFESSDFNTALTKSANNQYTLMSRLVDETKDALLAKAAIDAKIMG